MTAKRCDIKIRMREPLRAAIEREACNLGCSMNEVMIQRLQRSFDGDPVLAAIERLRADIARWDDSDWEAVAQEICDRYGVKVSCPL